MFERFMGGAFLFVNILFLLNEWFWGCLKSRATTPLLKGDKAQLIDSLRAYGQLLVMGDKAAEALQ